jgi:hypothetical protein
MTEPTLGAYFEAAAPIAVAKVYLLTKEEALPRLASGELIYISYEEMYS